MKIRCMTFRILRRWWCRISKLWWSGRSGLFGGRGVVIGNCKGRENMLVRVNRQDGLGSETYHQARELVGENREESCSSCSLDKIRVFSYGLARKILDSSLVGFRGLSISVPRGLYVSFRLGTLIIVVGRSLRSRKPVSTS